MSLSAWEQDALDSIKNGLADSVPRWSRGWPCSPGWPPPRTCRCGRRSRPSSWGGPAPPPPVPRLAWAGACCWCGWSPRSTLVAAAVAGSRASGPARAPDPGGRCAVTRPARPGDPADSLTGVSEQFRAHRGTTAGVQLDGGHELIVGQARQAVLQVEPGGAPERARSRRSCWATVSGDPTYSAPSGPASRSNDASVGMAKPRSSATAR